MMPGYEATLAHTRLRDQPPEDVGWVRTVLSAPGLARGLVHAIPRLAPEVYPPEAMPGLTALARVLGGLPAEASRVAAVAE